MFGVHLEGGQVALILLGLGLIVFTAYNHRLGRVCTRSGWNYRKDSSAVFWIGVTSFYATGLIAIIGAFYKK
jgi:hypothetical protein